MFHLIAALAPKPPEEPVCCLKPLTPLELIDDVPFFSFQDRKANRLGESSHGQKNNASPNPGAESSAEPIVHSTTTIITIATTTITNPSSSSSLSAFAANEAVDATYAPVWMGLGSTVAQSAAGGTMSMPAPAPHTFPHFCVPLTDQFS